MMAGHTENKAEDKLEYLSRSVLLEESVAPGLTHMIILVVCLTVAAFFFWAALTRMDEVAKCQGEVVVTGKVKRVQSVKGGVVQSIMVAEGDLVKKGQTLLRLEPTQLSSMLDQLRAQETALALRKEKLSALIEQRNPRFPLVDKKYQELAVNQLKTFEQILETLQSKRAILRNQVDQYKAQLKALDMTEKTVKSQFELVKEEFEAFKQAHRKDLVGKIDFLNVKKGMLAAQNSLLQIPMQRMQLMEKLDGTQNQLLNLETETREKWMLELEKTNEEASKLNEVLIRAQQDLSQLVINSPTDGIIHNLAIRSTGEVIRSGVTILEVVPSQRKLAVEAKVLSRDIGHLQLGQPANVKFTTYDFSRYGFVKGVLSKLSPTALHDPGGTLYYKAVISLERLYVGRDQDENPILPGMTVEVDIKTGSKSLAEYMLKPIYFSMKDSFGER